MKKIAVISVFYLLMGNVFAQEAQSVRFGFQASPTWSWMRTNDKKIEGIGSNWGLKFGALGEYYFAPNYAITTGLGFGLNQGGTIQNGYEKGVFWPKSDLSEPKFDTLSMNAKLHYRINYVEIPIGLRMRGGSNEDSRIKFYAELPVFTLGFVTKSLGDIRGTNSQNTSARRYQGRCQRAFVILGTRRRHRIRDCHQRNVGSRYFLSAPVYRYYIG